MIKQKLFYLYNKRNHQKSTLSGKNEKLCLVWNLIWTIENSISHAFFHELCVKSGNNKILWYIGALLLGKKRKNKVN